MLVRRKSLWRGPHSVSAADDRHRPQLPRSDRLPRPARPGTGRRTDRAQRRDRWRAAPCAWRTPANRATCTSPVTLLEAIEEFRFDALIGGARRDEEKKPAPRSASSATATASANGSPRPSAPSCGRCSTPACSPASTSACSHQQLDRAGRVAVHRPASTSACPASTTRTSARWWSAGPAGARHAADAPRTASSGGNAHVRFRTVGDITCTCPVESTAATPAEIVIEPWPPT